MTNLNILQSLKTLIQTPDLASKKWITQQYDSGVMNDTLSIGGDAAVVRVHESNKALALTSDCTPRYVEADPFEGAKQAVAETYRNISAVGATPLAITNCLNFGNPQKPEIMGQIVRAIKGINEACIALNYPVVSGNVSLYNETDGKAIQPTPAIGGVGILKDLTKRVDTRFKNLGDVVLIIGKTTGHLNCSLYEREILKAPSLKNPPKVDLKLEKKHGEFVRHLIHEGLINACHDVSDGGILVALFEMSSEKLGIKIGGEFLETLPDQNSLLFGEDQGRYIVSASSDHLDLLIGISKDAGLELFKIGEVFKGSIQVSEEEIKIKELQNLNEAIFPAKFS
ncbi:MAG: phosphoribosylformylglycinamidine (FGAM) synthase-like enzyme [Rickettsiales bacterium]|jgi:phosphoribosylformylglycinamidine (FGAM) synthase-like enzyme